MGCEDNVYLDMLDMIITHFRQFRKRLYLKVFLCSQIELADLFNKNLDSLEVTYSFHSKVLCNRNPNRCPLLTHLSIEST